MKRFGLLIMVCCLTIAWTLPASAQIAFPGEKIGGLKTVQNKSSVTLGNNAIKMSWSCEGDTLKPGKLTNAIGGQTFEFGSSLFQILLDDGRVIDSAKLKLSGAPRIEEVIARAESPRAGDHDGGSQIVAEMLDPETGLKVTWRAVLTSGANYIRQEFDLEPTTQNVAIKDIALLDMKLPDGRLSGPASGAPIVSKTMFAGIEDPMTSGTLTAGRALARLAIGVPIRKGQHFVRRTVIGVAPEGQLRRAFLYYIERERAHPYRPFLHYNSWWDLGIDPTKPRQQQSKDFTETECLDRIETVSRELVEKRGVKLDSFLFDDGWDNVDTVWGFNKYFPNGFANLRDAVHKHNIGIGIWISPLGGYRWKHDRRMIAGKAAGMEENKIGYALSGANYYKFFVELTTGMIKNYDVNMFKFDGISRNTIAPPGSAFSSDFQAAQAMLVELRKARKDVFINLTTGTWASPFWMLMADSIWRGGEDCDWTGVGSKRQQWITFRDAQTFLNVHKQCELYPLNSLMLHGIIYSYAMMNDDPQGDLKDEARSYFGNGTQLQELYIRPSNLKDKDWDTIAEAAKWSRKNAGVLVDTHWIGGDPAKLQVYGWAAWTPKGATLTLRNPSDKPREIVVSAQGAFELPQGAPQKFEMKSPYADQKMQTLSLSGADKVTVSLKPFEVVVFEGNGTE